VVRLHVEPDLGAGAKCALEAQRHRCADAGTPVQQRGQSLPGNAETLRDLTDRHALGEILAENLAGELAGLGAASEERPEPLVPETPDAASSQTDK